MDEILRFIGFAVVVLFYGTLFFYWLYVLVKKAVKDGILESQPWGVYDKEGNPLNLNPQLTSKPNAGSATK